MRRVAGKPLVAHTIEQARQACSVNQMVVSTDDAEVAAISRQFGAEVIWRMAPSNLLLLLAAYCFPMLKRKWKIVLLPTCLAH